MMPTAWSFLVLPAPSRMSLGASQTISFSLEALLLLGRPAAFLAASATADLKWCEKVIKIVDGCEYEQTKKQNKLTKKHKQTRNTNKQTAFVVV